jgi:hypothetical protein
MVVSEIQLYELLKSKIGEREAEAFVELLDKKVDKKFEDGRLLLATKEDLANAKTDIIRWVFAFFATLALMIIGLYLKN